MEELSYEVSSERLPINRVYSPEKEAKYCRLY
jgi:hypothetical protein